MNSLSSTPDSQQLRDLLARLTGHSWLAFSYVVGMILVIYIFGLYSSPGLLYVGIEVPTFLAVFYILSRNPLFKWHIAFLWPTSALMVWSYLWVDPLYPKPFRGEVFPLCVLLILGYWMLRATVHSKSDFVRNRQTTSVPYAIASVLTVWGAFLQIAFVTLLPLKFLVQDQIAESLTGSVLMAFLEMIRLTSPLAWFPVGLIALGLSLFVILGLEKEPYVARDYKDVLNIESPPIAEIILGMARLPIWIIIVILEFLKHIVMLAGVQFRHFLGSWLGRLGLVTFGLVLPLVAMVLGHALVYKSMSLVVGSPESGARHASIVTSLLEAALIHIFMLVALTLFVISVAPIAIRIESPNIMRIKGDIRQYLRTSGFDAAQSVGKAFVLYGLIVVAVPVAALIPNGAGWGVFSTLYGLILLFLGASYFLWDRLPEERRKEKQKQLARLLGSLKVASDSDKASKFSDRSAHAND